MTTLARTGGHKMAALKVVFMTTLIQTGGHKMAALKVVVFATKNFDS